MRTSARAAGVALTAPSIAYAPFLWQKDHKPNSKIRGVQVGVITYSYRSMDDQSAEATLRYVLGKRYQ